MLLLLLNTNVFAAAVAARIAVQFLLEQGWNDGERRLSFRPLYTCYLLANVVMAIGTLLFVAQLVPARLPGDPSGSDLIAGMIAGRPFVILAICAGLVFLRKSAGFPFIIAGLISVPLALIPAVFYSCGTRHSFMLVAEVFYLVWIYFDDLRIPAGFVKVSRPASQCFATAALVLASMICQPTGLKLALDRDSDSDAAARSIIARGLDRPDTLVVTTNPTSTTPLLLFFHHIRITYGLAPFGPAPQSYANSLSTRLRDHVPSLEEIKPLVLRLARGNPDKPTVVISVGSNDNELRSDPHYPLQLFYASPSTPAFTQEAYRLYQWK